MVSMALCVEQGPAHQPGCGEVLQAAQLHGQQARHLTLHTGLLHIPVLSQHWLARPSEHLWVFHHWDDD